jgi:glycosyltransferase involved in cell wall biosynthesis
MRILMLGSKEYPFGVSARHDQKAGGGIEVHVEKLSKYLARSGHEVFVLTRRFPGQASRETIREGPGRVHVIRTRFVPGRFMRAFSFNLLSFLRAIPLVRKEGIDLIHAHAVTAGFFGAKLSLLTGKPMVFTPHGVVVDWRFPARDFLAFFQKVALRMASRVLFISGLASRSMRTKAPSALLTNGIDLDDYDLPQRKGRDLTFLYLGRLEPVKGVDILIDAFTDVLGKFPGSRLLIAGDGSMKSQVLNKIHDAGTPRIRYLGWTDPREALEQCDAFVLPSREKGQPVALLEAMASARMIITSLPYVRDGETGLLCKPDRTSLARAMSRLCSSPQRFRRLGLNSRREATNLAWASVVKDFEREYLAAIRSRPCRGCR